MGMGLVRRHLRCVHAMRVCDGLCACAMGCAHVCKIAAFANLFRFPWTLTGASGVQEWRLSIRQALAVRLETCFVVG